MLHSIKHQSFKELKPDKATFFNTDNGESTSHGLACGGGNVCLENTQWYSLLGQWYSLFDQWCSLFGQSYSLFGQWYSLFGQ